MSLSDVDESQEVSMSELAVTNWLRSLGLSRYIQSFIDNGYDDLDVCRQIGDPDLDAIGVYDAGDRLDIHGAVDALVRQHQAATSSDSSATGEPGTNGQTSNDLNGDTITASRPANGSRPSTGPVYFTLENPDDYSRLPQPPPLLPFDCPTTASSDGMNMTESVDQATGLLDQGDPCPYSLNQLMMLIKDRLSEDDVRLNTEPYLTETGDVNDAVIKHLAMRYSGALNARVGDVLSCLTEIQSTQSRELTRPAQGAASVNDNEMFIPGTASSSDNLHDVDEASSRSTTETAPDYATAVIPADGMKGGSFSNTLGRFLKTVSLRRPQTNYRKYTYRQHDGDLNASEITMTEDDRIQLMILVKEGKLSVEEAVETVKKYRQLALEDTQENSEPLSTLQRKAASNMFASSVSSSPSRQTSCPQQQQPTNASSRDHKSSKSSFISPLFTRRAHSKPANGSTTTTRCAIPVMHRRKGDNVGNVAKSSSDASTPPGRTRRPRWSPPPLPPLPLPPRSGPIVESASAEFSSSCSRMKTINGCSRSQQLIRHLPDTTVTGGVSNMAPVAVSAVRKSHSLHSSSTALHQLMMMTASGVESQSNLDDDGDSSACLHADRFSLAESSETCSIDNGRSPKRHTPPSGGTPETQDPKRQLVVTEDFDQRPVHLNHEQTERTDCVFLSSAVATDGVVIVAPAVTDPIDSDTICSERRVRKSDNPDECISSGYDSSADQRDTQRTTVVKDSSSSSSGNRGVTAGGKMKINDSVVRATPNLTKDSVDRVHSSMDSLSNITCGTCGISSSSSHSSMSADDEQSIRLSSPLGRVRARCDSSRLPSSTEDASEALTFKKGDVICLLSLADSGICHGILNNCVGTFNIADVEVIPEDGTLVASPRHGRSSRGRRGLRRPKPKTVEELLSRLGLQKLMGVFTTSGFTSLEEFSELGEADLDDLNVSLSEDRIKLLTAAQLLSDCDTTGSDTAGGQHDDDSSGRSTSQSPALSQDASCQTLSFVATGRLGACIDDEPMSMDYNTPDVISSLYSAGNHPVATSDRRFPPASDYATASNGSNLEIDVTATSVADRPPNSTATNCNGRRSSSGSPKISGSSMDGRFISGTPPRSSSPSIRTAQVRQLVTGLPVAMASPSPIAAPCNGGWRTRFTSEVSSLPVLTRQHGQLVAAMFRLLAADKIDLAQPPYTNRVTGESGVPASLIRHYADVLHCGRSEAVLAMEDCRQRALLVSSVGRQQSPVVAVALPTDCASNDQISSFMQALGLTAYIDEFTSRGLTSLDHLRGLSVSDLAEMGISYGPHLQRLISAVEAIGALSERPARTIGPGCGGGGGYRQSTTAADSVRQRLASDTTTVVKSAADGGKRLQSSTNRLASTNGIATATKIIPTSNLPNSSSASISKIVDKV